ncbi:P-loop containing nucleoside triphosphate hydrolase protein [Rozella allomycis CSF55]|uniref:P-loop containing nucleoside triphosphate hydrolase protein n=1 Tax=Rozella allomycis (strain CSF55) TaxID=988480 RepID=A0A075B2Y8_ROZAC|nr:Small GTPase superfamily, ARF/SAR type domain-containing protein [Rozella allomycis CSF55]RKP19521.1 P-loop containing nucleoside triphosphate hydrolase protein [Rozella allomycis CSF55]|eukprot:EPZ36930.1 Small GTPase superfamily, ARF/SAR type domain-containing protein [Rozella allomycis CSF55]
MCLTSPCKTLFEWLKALICKREIEVTILGLQNSGKTSFVNSMANEEFQEISVPTVGFNVRKIKKGYIILRICDVGGHQRFRPLWERYCRNAQAIAFVIDLSDNRSLLLAKVEFQNLLENVNPDVPILILANKCDLANSTEVDEVKNML